jgi:hypothetical protein
MQECCVVFFSTENMRRDRTALDFLCHISKAALLSVCDVFGDPAEGGRREEDGEVSKYYMDRAE